ncbi:hypothetical protein FHY30_002160 [Xanthomonas arboricola]|uniref:hypothetical protein n=1 Tax=Xanthomonas campestris TaxID=339 RepID=UPI0023EA0687|nr:hypothetical protein [Xanthomonas campestris]
MSAHTRPAPGRHSIRVSEDDCGLGQFGGGAWLSEAALWPSDPSTGRPMTPIVMLTDLFLPSVWLADDMAVTVFAALGREGDAYNRTALRTFTIHQQSELEKIDAGHSKVVLHRRAAREMVRDTVMLPRHFVGLQPFDERDAEEEAEDADNGAGMSKQLGRPCWLQDPIHEHPRHYFLAQFVESDLRQQDPAYDGLFADGTGYLFAEQRAKVLREGDTAGYFFIQFT